MDREPNLQIYTPGHKANHLFVYGTLKKSFGRNDLLKECTYVKEDRMKGYLIHRGGFPALILEDKAPYVHGEVYRLPDRHKDLFATLDLVEGLPDLYWRLPVITFTGVACWVYFQSKDKILSGDEVIPTGRWVGYESPRTPWTRFMVDNPDYRWPTKPRTKYDKQADCMCVVQYKPNVDTAHPYLEVGPGCSTMHGFVERPSLFPDPRPKPPAPKPVPPMIELQWLDVEGSEPVKCDEVHVDGI